MAKRKTIVAPSLFDQLAAKQEIPVKEQPPEITEQPDIVPEKGGIVSEKEVIVPETACFVPEVPLVPSGKTVKLRDGDVLVMGEDVHCIYPGKQYENKIFIIVKMNDWGFCESGVLIVAVNKENPEEIVTSSFKDVPGLDANWFSKIKTDQI